MGIPPAALQPATLVQAIDVHADARLLARIPLDHRGPGEPYGGILVMTQRETERVLLEHLQRLGGAVEWETELIRFALDRTGVSAVVRRGGRDETIRVAYLVGCDGARSVVRRLLDIRFEGATYDETFALADVRLDWDRPRDEGAVWFSPAGVLFALPLPEPVRWRLIVSFPPGQTPGPLSLDLFQRLLRERAGDERTTVSNPDWLSEFRVNRRLAARYRDARVLLAGDAAHIHSPVGGQGMNTGIQDAFNLGWKLALAAQGRAASGLLDSYQAERRPVARRVLFGTNAVTRLALADNPLLRAARDLIAPLAIRLPGVAAGAVRQISELAITYRDGPLAGPACDESDTPLLRRQLGAPRPGDRAPDGKAQSVPGDAPATLFERFAHGGFTLLLFPDERPAALADAVAFGQSAATRHSGLLRATTIVRHTPGVVAPDADILLDADGETRRLYGADQPRAWLVRPDGYLAACLAIGDDAALAACLARIVAPAG
jgi:4,5-epoxidase